MTAAPPDWTRIEDDWHAYSDMAREKWPRIPPETLRAAGGRREPLIEAVQRAYDVSRLQARREVDHWMKEAPHDRAMRADHRRADRPRMMRRPPSTSGGRIAGRSRDAAGGTVAAAWGQARAHPFATLLLAVGVGMLVGRAARAMR